MEIRVHDVCKRELDEIRRASPKTYDQILKDLKKMAAQSDPTQYVRVKPMYGIMRGYYRLAVYYPLSVRVIFRFMVKAQNGLWFEINVSHRCYTSNKREKILQIVRVGYRCSVYSNLWKRVQSIK